MPKQNRKRKHSHGNVEYVTDQPKNKCKPFDEVAKTEEEHLSKILFGGAPDFLRSLEEASREAGTSHLNSDSGVGDDDSDDSATSKERKPAWFDEEDDGIDVGKALESQGRKLPKGGHNDRANRYKDLLQHKFTSVVGTPKWASLNRVKASDSDSDDEILQTCGFIRKTVKANLPQNVLEYKKVRDLNCETYSEGPYINSIEFHPSSSVALVAGHAGVATLYAVDGKRNNKLHSVGFQRFPIFCAKYVKNGNEVILGSRHSHIYSYDLLAAKTSRIQLPPGMTQMKDFITSPDEKYLAVAGKWGEVHILTSISKERVTTLKQDGNITALTYDSAGELLFGHSDTGEVTIWDMNMRKVKHKFIDEGCLQGSAISVSSSNQFIATGSAQGVVNLYGLEDVLHTKLPKPRRTILNLTTEISNAKFNSFSEILALSSPVIPNSVKLFHLGSGTVFSNFPSFEAKLGHVNVLSFSPNCGYVAFGNRKSTVSLYRLKHYNSY